MSEHRAVIFGATGLVGEQVLELACASPRYSKVLSLGRRPSPLTHSKHESRVIDLARPESYADAITSDSDVYCCLGTTIKSAGSQAAFRIVDHDYPLAIATQAKQNSAAQFLIVTALGSDAKSPVFYNRVKGELEQALIALQLSALHIFRPSLLLGDRKEHRLGERLISGPMRAIGPLFVGPLRKYRAIEAKDVAQAMIQIAQNSQPGTHTYDSDRIHELAHS